MKKVIIINAIVSVALFVVMMLLPTDTLLWTHRLSSCYSGYSIGVFILSLCGVYDRKNITPRKQLQVTAIFVISFCAFFSTCICAFLIESLHAGPFGVMGFLFVMGICMLVYSIRNRKKREELPE